MVINVRPVIFGGKNLGVPGWKDIVVEDLDCTKREGNTAL